MSLETDLRRIVEEQIAAGDYPGASIYVSRSGRPLLEAAYGDASVVPERSSTSPDTLYDLASLTKAIATAPVLMRRAAAGEIALEEPIHRVLYEFDRPDTRSITVRDLLSHSAGLPEWVPFYEELRKEFGGHGPEPAEARHVVLRRIAAIELRHAPGAESHYGDLDFIVLGEAIERACGRPIWKLFGDEIASPLGVSGELHFRPRGEEEAGLGDPSRYAPTENCPWRGRILRAEVHDGNAWILGGATGHAGLFGTARAVGRAGEELLAAEAGRSKLFDAAVVKRFFTRQTSIPGSTWALGWDTPSPEGSTAGRHFSPDSVGHLGYTGTSIWMDRREGIVVVFLTNRVHPKVPEEKFAKRSEIHDRIREALG